MLRHLSISLALIGFFFGGPLGEALGVAPPEECTACRRGKVCRPHLVSDKAEIKRLSPELESDDKDVRARALGEVARLTRDHENAPSKEVAEVLVAALEDDQLTVQQEALRLLAHGQHPETAVRGYIRRLDWFRANMWSLVADMTGPKEEHGTAADAMGVLQSAVTGAAELRDDRIVDSLGKLLASFPAEMRGEPVAMAATRALLSLGTRDAVDSVLKQFPSPQDTGKSRQVHVAMVTFANRLEVDETPAFGDTAQADWATWVRKHKRQIPKKLGKWTGPPEEDDEDDDPSAEV